MINVLITGISGEVGHGLVKRLSSTPNKYQIYALDIVEPGKELFDKIKKTFVCDISDKKKIDEIFKNNKFDVVFHLAAILSTGGEKVPEKALEVNLTGTVNLFEAATNQSLNAKKSIKFLFPSSIAAYGIPTLDQKKKNPRVKENEFLSPVTIYGVTKLACENIGTYFSKNYKLLNDFDRNNLIDFRCIRFPGLLSPDTVPTGGTSDYGPEMLHYAAQNKAYACFVRPDAQIPFMAMDDAADALIKLSEAPKEKLKNTVYNISGFSVSAKEIEKKVKKFFPKAKISYKVTKERQGIVDSWPMDVDDDNAKKDWGFKAKFSFEKTFADYLVPKVKERYSTL